MGTHKLEFTEHIYSRLFISREGSSLDVIGDREGEEV
jgi:hypothetical protein